MIYFLKLKMLLEYLEQQDFTVYKQLINIQILKLNDPKDIIDLPERHFQQLLHDQQANIQHYKGLHSLQIDNMIDLLDITDYRLQ